MTSCSYCRKSFQSTLPARGATATWNLLQSPIMYFNPRSPRGERRKGKRGHRHADRFQSTLPARGATLGVIHHLLGDGISIHAPREGSDLTPPTLPSPTTYFNPRSPRGERRFQPPEFYIQFFISIHAPREGSDGGAPGGHGRGPISIHAPREGSDIPGTSMCCLMTDFNPRSPRGERRDKATQAGVFDDFNPRSPRGERPVRLVPLKISLRFQSTLPARGATCGETIENPYKAISIHAPREGSDAQLMREADNGEDFNPRSPRGERLTDPKIHEMANPFQSTLPARGATLPGLRYSSRPGRISIHAPREGSDIISRSKRSRPAVFQSTLPARGATRPPPRQPGAGGISIHAPREGSDKRVSDSEMGEAISIHAPREGSDSWPAPLTPQN